MPRPTQQPHPPIRVAALTVSDTLAQVRPWSLMVVIADPDDYLDDMLVAAPRAACTSPSPSVAVASTLEEDEQRGREEKS